MKNFIIPFGKKSTNIDHTMQNIRDLVCFIKALTELELEGNARYELQDILMGNKERNAQKDKYGELQNFENLMHELFLNDIDTDKCKQETILQLLAIFINLFEIYYIDNNGHLPQSFIDRINKKQASNMIQ